MATDPRHDRWEGERAGGVECASPLALWEARSLWGEPAQLRVPADPAALTSAEGATRLQPHPRTPVFFFSRAGKRHNPQQPKMNPLREYMEKGPAWARVLPFAVFLVLTFLQDWVRRSRPILVLPGQDRRRCLAGLGTAPGCLRSPLGFQLGGGGGRRGGHGHLGGAGSVLSPNGDHRQAVESARVFREGSALAWFALCLRVFGMTFVVPPLEEAFYRSFLYRYLVKLDFLQMPLNRMHGLSFVVTSVAFGLVHHQWLAGILCGLDSHQFLVIRKGRLGDAMTAHAITNFLLAVWVIWKGDWKFF